LIVKKAVMADAVVGEGKIAVKRTVLAETEDTL